MNLPTEKSSFDVLSEIDIRDKIEKKGRFNYLSWAYAVQELKKHFPKSTWEIKRFDGMPFLKTELGYFVEVSVTVDNVPASQIHPVLDFRNKPIQKPTSFDINTSIQRCFVKAIALHGLGLGIYAGEDLSTPQNHKKDKFQEKINLNTKLIEIAEKGDVNLVYDAFINLTDEEKEILGDNINKAQEFYLRSAEDNRMIINTKIES